MQDNLFDLLVAENRKQELGRVLACNEKSGEFGLVLSGEDAEELMVCRQETLKDQRRVEFGEGILPKLIEAFCDSQYIQQDMYLETLAALQEVFYLFKNEAMDRLADDELIAFMRQQFEDVCFGSVEYLAETCLERYAQAIRAGYDGFLENGGIGEYSQFSEEERWDRKLFLEVLWEMLS